MFYHVVVPRLRDHFPLLFSLQLWDLMKVTACLYLCFYLCVCVHTDAVQVAQGRKRRMKTM